MKKNYQSNITDKQWDKISKIMQDTRKRKYSLRQIWNAIFYLLKTGCQWRNLPNDFPPYESVYYYFSKWTKDGTFDLVYNEIHGEVRRKAGREESPSLAVIDSQSVRTTRSGGKCSGFDGNKKINGRKRHIQVDTLGLPVGISVHAANINDGKAAYEVIFEMKEQTYCPRLKTILADGGYRGQELRNNIKRDFDISLEVVLRKDENKSFKPISKRWIVERSFSWLESYRRLAKDYEYEVINSVYMIKLAFLRIMLNRIIE